MSLFIHLYTLKHWHQDEIAAILQTAFWNAFSSTVIDWHFDSILTEVCFELSHLLELEICQHGLLPDGTMPLHEPCIHVLLGLFSPWTRCPSLRRRNFQMHFLEWKWVSINISLKFVPKGQINNIQALVQLIVWRLTGDKPLSEPMVA